MIGDLPNHPAKVVLWIETVQFRRLRSANMPPSRRTPFFEPPAGIPTECRLQSEQVAGFVEIREEYY
jgi:hypothetical protein